MTWGQKGPELPTNDKSLGNRSHTRAAFPVIFQIRVTQFDVSVASLACTRGSLGGFYRLCTTPAQVIKLTKHWKLRESWL